MEQTLLKVWRQRGFTEQNTKNLKLNQTSMSSETRFSPAGLQPSVKVRAHHTRPVSRSNTKTKFWTVSYSEWLGPPFIFSMKNTCSPVSDPKVRRKVCPTWSPEASSLPFKGHRSRAFASLTMSVCVCVCVYVCGYVVCGTRMCVRDECVCKHVCVYTVRAGVCVYTVSRYVVSV